MLVNVDKIGNVNLKWLKLGGVYTFSNYDIIMHRGAYIYLEEFLKHSLMVDRFVRYSPVIAELYELPT